MIYIKWIENFNQWRQRRKNFKSSDYQRLVCVLKNILTVCHALMNGFWPALYVINAVLYWRIASNFTTYSSAIFPLDIDECATNENRCSHKCNNTEGSYACSCVDGFRLDADNVTCLGGVFIILFNNLCKSRIEALPRRKKIATSLFQL